MRTFSQRHNGGQLDTLINTPRSGRKAEPIVREALRQDGEALDHNTKASMESRFACDFSRVRIHANERAGAAASALSARAFTVNNDIVFGPGQYRPEVQSGRQLLAHELAHVVQRGGHKISLPTDGMFMKLSFANDPAELEASRAAVRVAQNQNVLLSRRPIDPAATILREPLNALQDPLLQERSEPPYRPPDATNANPVAGMFEAETSPLSASSILEFFLEHKRSLFTRIVELQFNFEKSQKNITSKTVGVLRAATIQDAATIPWTYDLSWNETTGDLFVRESQDNTGIVNYWQGTIAKLLQKSRSGQMDDVDGTTIGGAENIEIPRTDRDRKHADARVDEPATDKSKKVSDATEKNKEKSKKADGKLKLIIFDLAPILMGTYDQSWLPGQNWHGMPARQGDLSRALEIGLSNLAKQIQQSSTPPKTLSVCVSTFNYTGVAAPGYMIAAQAGAFNVRSFLQSKIGKSVAITSTFRCSPNLPYDASAKQVIVEITPGY